MNERDSLRHEPWTPPRAAVEPWVRELVRYLDTAFVIPGTRIRVGLDPIVGLLFPVVGDWLGAFTSMVLLRAALERRVPPVIVLRMVLNVTVDTVLGMIPIAGDVFDVAFRANQRNLELLERHAREGKPRPGDYAVIALAVLVVIALALLPLVIVGLVVGSLASG